MSHEGMYGGIYANGGGWRPGAAWSYNRKDTTRAMQAVARDRDLGLEAIGGLGQMSWLEEQFQRVFGPRGIAEAELETSAQRGELQSVYERFHSATLHAKGDRVARMVELDARVLRHLQTYPTTSDEGHAWSSTASALIREMKHYLFPTKLVLGLAAGAALLAVGAGYWRKRRRR